MTSLHAQVRGPRRLERPRLSARFHAGGGDASDADAVEDAVLSVVGHGGPAHSRKVLAADEH